MPKLFESGRDLLGLDSRSECSDNRLNLLQYEIVSCEVYERGEKRVRGQAGAANVFFNPTESPHCYWDPETQDVFVMRIFGE